MIILVFTWVGIGCWCVCFWWMHRISSRQDAMLKDLHEMTQRVEQLSQAEHDLIKEVHPKVGLAAEELIPLPHGNHAARRFRAADSCR
jgi:hypothetical protein